MIRHGIYAGQGHLPHRDSYNGYSRSFNFRLALPLSGIGPTGCAPTPFTPFVQSGTLRRAFFADAEQPHPPNLAPHATQMLHKCSAKPWHATWAQHAPFPRLKYPVVTVNGQGKKSETPRQIITKNNNRIPETCPSPDKTATREQECGTRPALVRMQRTIRNPLSAEIEKEHQEEPP